jgi:serine/threonine protein kinase
MAPEVLFYKKFEVKSDVWSYGILLWEMVTFGDFPHEDKDINSVLKLADKGQLLLEPPSNSPAKFKSVITVCQNRNPKLRPSFQELTEHFVHSTPL